MGTDGFKIVEARSTLSMGLSSPDIAPRMVAQATPVTALPHGDWTVVDQGTECQISAEE